MVVYNLIVVNVAAELDDQVLAGGGQAATQEWNEASVLVRLKIFHSLHSE